MYAHISAVPDVGTTEWESLLSLISVTESSKVTKFFHNKDKKLSILSILLQRKLIRDSLRLNDHEFTIKRTKLGKPFAAPYDGRETKWNYNVSHHGEYVFIASSSDMLIGIDLMQLSVPMNPLKNQSCDTSKFSSFFEPFKTSFSAEEIKNLVSLGERSEIDQFVGFYINWSLKEAFVKAIGTGIGVELSRIAFKFDFPHDHLCTSIASALDNSGVPRLTNSSREGETNTSTSTNMETLSPHAHPCFPVVFGSAQLSLNGMPRRDWQFDTLFLDGCHVAAVARGRFAHGISGSELGMSENGPSSSASDILPATRVQGTERKVSLQTRPPGDTTQGARGEGGGGEGAEGSRLGIPLLERIDSEDLRPPICVPQAGRVQSGCGSQRQSGHASKSTPSVFGFMSRGSAS
jgi:phosphopantetheinyl transferase